MDVEMNPPLFKSTAVHSFGWEPIKSGQRGNLHIQFHNKDGELTNRGYFAMVQRSLHAGLQGAMKPGKFIHDNLREHFEWVALNDDGSLAFNGDDYANPLVIPADCPNTIAAIEACYDAQRVKPKGGLFA